MTHLWWVLAGIEIADKMKLDKLLKQPSSIGETPMLRPSPREAPTSL
jgi:hypothetical protein